MLIFCSCSVSRQSIILHSNSNICLLPTSNLTFYILLYIYQQCSIYPISVWFFSKFLLFFVFAVLFILLVYRWRIYLSYSKCLFMFFLAINLWFCGLMKRTEVLKLTNDVTLVKIGVVRVVLDIDRRFFLEMRLGFSVINEFKLYRACLTPE